MQKNSGLVIQSDADAQSKDPYRQFGVPGGLLRKDNTADEIKRPKRG
jgi:hypothetical protein